MKAHLEQAILAVRNEENQNLFAPATQARLKTLTQATEVEIGKILGPEGLAKFREWKVAPLNPTCQFFGEPYRQHAGQDPAAPVPPPPGTGPGTPEQF
mgnify:CR=1 FL=1